MSKKTHLLPIRTASRSWCGRRRVRGFGETLEFACTTCGTCIRAYGAVVARDMANVLTGKWR